MLEASFRLLIGASKEQALLGYISSFALINLWLKSDGEEDINLPINLTQLSQISAINTQMFFGDEDEELRPNAIKKLNFKARF
jgi:hypothetical protein